MNGKKTRFWNDPWLYEKTVYTIIPTLFILCEQREGIVADVKSGEIQITFRRWLTAKLQTRWEKICSDVNNFWLLESDDIIIWKLEKNKTLFCQIYV